MNCKELSYEICNEIENYISISGHMQEDMMREREVDFTNSIGKELELEEYQTKMYAGINSLLDNLYKKSKEENFIFFDAPLSVYKIDVKNKIEKYFKLNIDALEIEFYENQLKLLNQPENLRVLIDQYGYEVNYHYLLKNKRNFETSLKRKKEFIVEKINNLNPKPLCKDKEEKESYNKKIFKSKEAQVWFNFVLDELSAIDENKKAANKFAAKVNSIYKRATAKNVIFKYQLLLKNYIKFLNKVYYLNQTYYDKLSDGKNYDKDVDVFIDSYLNKQKLNSSE